MIRYATAPLFVCALLSGCVTVPTGPTALALPGSQKGLDQFQADDASCRTYAYGLVAGPGQAVANNAAGNAAAGTAIGAATGALIGAASGSAGPGAAIGAGMGLLFGSAAASNYAGYSYYDLQHYYNMAYLQCMYAHGNRVPVRSAYAPYGPAYAMPRNAPPDYGAPPDYRAPPDYPPPDYPPPPDARGVNPPAGNPPAPPPRG